ncbi:hypothetical protein GMD78_10225 [Ornithinibacillus sp. L9]|uniref:Anti-sigma-W factor RsiW n=1 Tax=Ornithinibacillus caprae TaxID=2678566 RepID=A0A6N8FN37_9BACI|nr:anti-sigma factor [Ornithinibacillus caprae]MUK88768.1 hypothetical protein [Ornithinibacillus caprae]
MKHINEELIIDYALGKVSQDQAKAIQKHLMTCDKCQHELNYWQQILSTDNQTSPSLELQNRINHTISEIEQKRKWRWPKKHGIIVAGIAIILLLIVSVHQLNQPEMFVESDPYFVTAQHEQIPEKSFMENPDTNRLDILPATINENVKGDVWLNEVTNEMVLRVDGLDPLPTQDYQLWFVDQDDHWNGELLHLRDGTAHIYYRNSDINQLKLIKVSIEPLGGSHTPTGPETFYLNFNY